MLMVEIGSDMSVFGSAQRLASSVGMCPGNNESAGKRKKLAYSQGQRLGELLTVRVCTGCAQEPPCAQG